MPIKQVLAYCKQQKINLNAARLEILTIIFLADKPLGAYEILAQLRQTLPKAEPPTVYRALNFLLKYHLIHRVAASNSYISCQTPGKDHWEQMISCTHCGRVIETAQPDLIESVKNCLVANQFALTQVGIEIHALCQNCQVDIN